MSDVSRRIRAIGMGALLCSAASCQLVAGVRNDGELESTSAGGARSSSSADSTASTSASTSTSTSASTSDASSSSSAMVPMCGGYECHDTCVEDTFCATATCTPGAPFDVFTSADLGGHALADTLPSVISNGQLVVGVVDTVSNTLLVRGIGTDTTVTPTASFPLGTDARFEQARFGSTKTVFQGRMNGEIVEIRFSFAIGDMAPHSPMPVSFGKPAACSASEAVERVRFTLGDLDEVSYVANCNDPGTSYQLVMGGETTPAAVVASGTAPTTRMKVDAYEYSKGYHLILTGDGRAGEQPYFRGGTTVQSLQTAKPFRLSGDLQRNPARLILARNAPIPNDFLFVGLDYDPLDGGALWVGTFEDPATLGGALPLAGFTEIAALDGTTTKNHFGAPGNAFPAPSGGIIGTVVALDELSLSLTVVSDAGVVVAPFQFVHVAQGAKIWASAVGYDGFDNIVSWIEDANGVYRVRAAVVECKAIDAP